MNKWIARMLWCSVTLHLFFMNTSASELVENIVVRGNKNVSTQKILRVVRIGKGDPYSDKELRIALKRLFATKEFSDVKAYKSISGDKVTLEIEVSEYPRIDEVRLDGLEHVTEEDAKKAISIAQGTFARPALIAKDMNALEELYKEKGYYRVSVEDTIVQEKGKSVLVYNIKAGDKVSIRHIDFFGNGLVSSDDLRKVMESKEDRWWRGGDFKPKTLEEDDEKILSVYRRHGFLDASIKDKELVFSKDGKNLDIFITVDEGTQYKVGKITWHGNSVVSSKEIQPLIFLSPGDVFDEKRFTDMQMAISSLYWDRGYIYNSVTPVKRIHGDVIDADMEIIEGNPAHINEIRIEGNTKTSEEVIRRELVISPGDVFLRPRLIRSLREVFNLGFFAGPPEVTPTPANEEGDVNITLKVQEKQTGQFRLGAGFSQLNSISGFFGISEPNFLGKGQNVGIDWEFSKYRQNVDVRFTEPWLLGTPTELSVNVYNLVQNQVRQQFYDDRRRGFSIRIGRPFPWFDYTSVYWRYRYESVELTNFSPGYVGPLLSISWPQRTSSTSITLTRNSTDSPFRPTMGTSSFLTAEFNGGALLGGDAEFQKYEASFSWYTALPLKFVLEMRFQAGVLDGYGAPSQVPDYELFRLGGNRRYGIRGYDFYEIVPEGNPEFIGGRYMQILAYQISYELAPSIYGLLFLDSGNAWNSFTGADLLDMKKGAGVGIRFELPMLGTVGLDYGYGFDKRGGGAWEPHISFGGLF